MSVVLGYIEQAVVLTVAAAVLSVTGYLAGMVIRWFEWLWSTGDDDAREASGLYGPRTVDREVKRPAGRLRRAVRGFVGRGARGRRSRLVGRGVSSRGSRPPAGRWWRPWGDGLTVALVVLGSAWVALNILEPYGPSETGWWAGEAVEPGLWLESAGIGLWWVAAWAAVVFFLAARAGWRGLIGWGVPLGAWVVFGAVAAAAPMLRHLAVTAGVWPAEQDLHGGSPGYVVLGTVVAVLVWGAVVGSRRWREAVWAERTEVRPVEQADGRPDDAAREACDLASNRPTRTAREDRLDRRGAASGLARLIHTEEPPFVLGIDGEWGSGKSSLMHLLSERLHEYRDWPHPAATSRPAWNVRGVQRRLRKQFPTGEASPETSWAAGRVVVVRVNLWAHQHDELPAVALLQAARDTLPPGARHEATDDIKAIMATGGADAVSLKDLALGGASGEVSLGALRRAVLAGRADRFALQEHQAKLSSRFARVIDEVRRAHNADRVVFILDDLDRCLPAVALDLLEKVHLMFQEPACVTVIGIDTRILELTVAKRYLDQGAYEEGKGPSGDSSKEAATLAREYVEKVFDFSYRIPPVDDARLKSYITGMLQPLAQQEKKEPREDPTEGTGGRTSAWARLRAQLWKRPGKTLDQSPVPAVDSRKNALDKDIIGVIVDLFAEGASACGASLRRTKRLVNSFIMYHSFACDTTVPRTIEAFAGTATPVRSEPSVDRGGAAEDPEPDTAEPEPQTADSARQGSGERSVDTAQVPALGYFPFLMAAVSAIMVLYPKSYRALSGAEKAIAAERWFVQVDGAPVGTLTEEGADGLRETIMKGMKTPHVDLARMWASPEDRKVLVDAVVRYVQMMESPQGEMTTFGTYQGKPLTWRVLTTDSAGRRLLLCEEIVRKGPYHRDWGTKSDPITWQKSDLRRWLNGRPSGVRGQSGWEEWTVPDDAYTWAGGRRKMKEGESQEYWPSQPFLEYFSRDEIARIHQVVVSTEGEHWSAARLRKFYADMEGGYKGDVGRWKPDEWVRNWKDYWEVESDDDTKIMLGGGDVSCRVFLLSLAEAKEFFESDSDRIAQYETAPGWWWLRSPGNRDIRTAVVAPGGWLDRNGIHVGTTAVGVRPALWLNP
ncbi:MAG: KAP family NTPase [Micrococcales bacterium]|nr:KAP family NTPase [Micrococcales bacterium]